LQQAAKRVLVYCDHLHKKGKTDKANILFFSVCTMLEEQFQIEESTGTITRQCGAGAKGRTFILNQALLASLKDS
jgi:ABC-type transport system involved in Fe-S cluster assembly fused permease/ATPase subunit